MKNNNFDIIEALWLRKEKKRRAQKIIEGALPLTYTAKKAGTLTDYRIYGQTVDGESVGDRTENLFDGFSVHGKVPSVSNGELINSPSGGAATDFIAIDNGDITLSKSYAAESNIYIFLYAQDKTYIGYSQTTTVDTLILYGNSINGYQNAKYARIRVDIESIYMQTNIMLNAGSTPLPYEPYGYKVPVTVEGKNLVSSYLVGNSRERYAVALWCEIDFKPNTEYIIDFIYAAGAQFYTNEYIFETIRYTNTLGGKRSWRIKTKSTIDKNSGYQYNANEGWIILKSNTETAEDIEISDVQIRLAPVTTPIYLPEQIRKVGDEAEYIDYAEQKQHFADGTSVDVTLPALPTIAGTNTLSVGTQVQPSSVKIEGKIKGVS